MGGEHRLDLSQLDAHAADLHLMVEAAEVVEAAVGQEAGEVAGPVETAAGATGAAGEAESGSGTKRSAVRSGRRQ